MCCIHTFKYNCCPWCCLFISPSLHVSAYVRPSSGSLEVYYLVHCFSITLLLHLYYKLHCYNRSLTLVLQASFWFFSSTFVGEGVGFFPSITLLRFSSSPVLVLLIWQSDRWVSCCAPAEDSRFADLLVSLFGDCVALYMLCAGTCRPVTLLF
jgi:hypothetical protein